MSFGEVSVALQDWALAHGLQVHYSYGLDPFFKGDLDGQSIWIDDNLPVEDKVFNTAHLIGHCIQWALSEEDYELGRLLYAFPEEDLLKRLIDYEWRANCYGYQILRDCGYFLMGWMNGLFQEDIARLVHYYKTGEIVQKAEMINAPVVRPLQFPDFTPKRRERNRNGIVV